MRHRRTRVLAASLVLGAAACAVLHPKQDPPAPAGGVLVAADPNAPMPAPNTCHARGQLPDPTCTPGAINPDVNQGNIDATICKSGWTKTVRPAVSVTNRWKAESARAYGIPQGVTGEYDHLVPLELGGAPLDARNLWVEVGSIPNGKDAIEDRLNTAVCGRLVPLADSQAAIAKDWTTATKTVGITDSGPVCLVAQKTKCTGDHHPEGDG